MPSRLGWVISVSNASDVDKKPHFLWLQGDVVAGKWEVVVGAAVT